MTSSFSALTGAVAFPGSTFGAGSGYIFYGDVACDGSEASLDDCSSTIAPSCSHSEDAGVRCIGKDSGPFVCPLED